MPTKPHPNEWLEPDPDEERKLLHRHMDILGITVADLEDFKQFVHSFEERTAG